MVCKQLSWKSNINADKKVEHWKTIMTILTIAMKTINNKYMFQKKPNTNITIHKHAFEYW